MKMDLIIDDCDGQDCWVAKIYSGKRLVVSEASESSEEDAKKLLEEKILGRIDELLSCLELVD